MNILIVSSKSDAKAYKSVLKTASDTNVLGAVTTIKTEFITELKNKWLPHIVIFDTAVPAKRVNITDVIFSIRAYYPYIKVIVVTDKNDKIDYPLSYTVIKGQITGSQLKDVIKNIKSSNIDFSAFETDDIENTEELSNKTFDSNITEKLSDIQEDNLSTPIKIPEIKKKRKHRIKNKGIIIAVGIALSVFVVILISVIILKSSGNAPLSTADEVINTSSAVTELPTEEQETDVLPSDYTADDFTVAVQSSTVNSVATVSIEDNTTAESSSEKISSSHNDYSESAASNSNSSSSQSGYTNNDNNNSNFSSSSSSSGTSSNSAIISYDNNRYQNSSDDKVQNVKLSYKSKTMYVGDVLNMQFSIQPTSAKYGSIRWNSSNPLTADVDSNGNITAFATGSTTITVTVDSVSAQCTVKVIKNPL